MNWFQQKLVAATPLRRKIVVVKMKQYKVYFIEPALMEEAQSFGHVVGEDIYLRADLPKRVERFVIQHEIYHLNDRRTWLGWIGRETRANIMCGAKNPFGLIATIRASLTKPRLNTYWNALMHNGEM